MKKVLNIIVCLSIMALAFSCSPKPNEPYNIHIWELPNGDIIKYYEIWDGHSGFTANLAQYLLWQQGGKPKKYYIGVGGSHKSVTLIIDTNKKAIWLKGKYTGGKFHYVAALNLVNGTFLNKDRLYFDEKELTKDGFELKNILNNEQGVLVKESK